jgi:hypothetical protein
MSYFPHENILSKFDIISNVVLEFKKPQLSLYKWNWPVQ